MLSVTLKYDACIALSRGSENGLMMGKCMCLPVTSNLLLDQRSAVEPGVTCFMHRDLRFYQRETTFYIDMFNCH